MVVPNPSNTPKTVGIDLDNTLVCYDEVFAELALRKGIEVDPLNAKSSLKEAMLKKPGGNLDWTLVQGLAYGPELQRAKLFEEAFDVVKSILVAGNEVAIISHKTRFPAVGEAYDLQASARQFLRRHIIERLSTQEQKRIKIHLCATLHEKMFTIRTLDCIAFVDDLVEVLQHPLFPARTKRIHFSPKPSSVNFDLSANNWIIIGSFLSALMTGGPFTKPAGLGLPVSSVDTGCRASPREPESVFPNMISLLGEVLSSMTPLSGGINNQVFRLDCHSGNTLCGKIYKREAHDPRDRMLHEVRFLEFCEANGITQVPRLLAKDWEMGASILSWIEGECFPEDQPVPDHYWQQCVSFFHELQKHRWTPSAMGLPRAAEGATSLQQHLGWVQERRDFWRIKAGKGELDNVTADYVMKDLEERYQKVATECLAHPEFRKRFIPENMVINPSDFGLHNSLIDSVGRLWFFDFEYAGWDDMNKALLDFELQPKYMENRSKLGKITVPIVWDLLKLKWSYIVLNYQSRSSAV